MREAYGIREGDYVIVEARSEGILIRPARRIDFDEIREILREHLEELAKLDTVGSKLGELAGVSLEEEFEA